MDSVLIHNHKIPVPGVSRKILYHFSDVHLALADELSSKEEQERSEQSREGWEGTRKYFADAYHEPCEASQQLPAEVHFANLLQASADGDAVLMAGDLCDFVSGANLRFLDRQLGVRNQPWLAVCGNHDLAQDIPEGYVFSRTKQPVQVLDLGDLLVLGFDNSRRSITRQQNEQLKAALSLGKPLVILMHVPIMTEGNAEILIRCGEYFRLNHPDAEEETLTFIETIRENAPQITAVLAGHLHFRNESEIAPGLTQYVSSQGILGNINRYEIGI